jgi:L-ascorbate metabolism protein UlaG (beta-lactamase superfamily)
MEITYLGHSSFRLKTKTSVVICDPYDPKKVGLKFPKYDAEIVTVSHEHDDHNYVSGVREVRKVVSGVGEYEISDVSIIGLPSYHDEKEGVERGKNVIYVIESEGIRLCHLGDLGHTLSDKTVEEIGEVNILFIPVGGVYTIGPEDAVKVVADIEPNIVIPMHFKVPGLTLSKATEMKGVDEFLNDSGMTSEKLPKLSVRESDFGEEQKVILLEKRD